MIRETAGRLFNHSQVSAGIHSGWLGKGVIQRVGEMPIAQSSGVGAVRDFSPPSVQIVKFRKPCELDGRIDRLFKIDAFRIGRCRDVRGPDAPHHIGSSDLAEHGLEVARLAE